MATSGESMDLSKYKEQDFLVDQQLRLYTVKAERLGSIPGWGTKIPHAVPHSQKMKERRQNTRSKDRILRNITIQEVAQKEEHR